MVTPLCFHGLTQRQGSKPQQSSSSEHPQAGGLPGALLEVPSTTGCWICREQSVSFYTRGRACLSVLFGRDVTLQYLAKASWQFSIYL